MGNELKHIQNILKYNFVAGRHNILKYKDLRKKYIMRTVWHNIIFVIYARATPAWLCRYAGSWRVMIAD